MQPRTVSHEADRTQHGVSPRLPSSPKERSSRCSQGRSPDRPGPGQGRNVAATGSRSPPSWTVEPLSGMSHPARFGADLQEARFSPSRCPAARVSQSPWLVVAIQPDHRPCLCISPQPMASENGCRDEHGPSNSRRVQRRIQLEQRTLPIDQPHYDAVTRSRRTGEESAKRHGRVCCRRIQVDRKVVVCENRCRKTRSRCAGFGSSMSPA